MYISAISFLSAFTVIYTDTATHCSTLQHTATLVFVHVDHMYSYAAAGFFE